MLFATEKSLKHYQSNCLTCLNNHKNEKCADLFGWYCNSFNKSENSDMLFI